MSETTYNSIREVILNKSRLARMRLGQDVPEMAEIPSQPEVRCALVPLNEAEAQQGVLAAASVVVEDNVAGMNLRNRAAMQMDVFNALRDPSDLSRKIFLSCDEMVEALEPRDIDVIADQLAALMEYSSPAIDGLSDKDLTDLKKAFDTIEWSGLSGKRWAAVKLACQVLTPDLLRAKLFGSTSTESSTEKKSEEESTSDA